MPGRKPKSVNKAFRRRSLEYSPDLIPTAAGGKMIATM